jgi:hypothetical protein
MMNVVIVMLIQCLNLEIIEILNYTPLKIVIHYAEIPRIFEDDEAEDSYTDSLEEGDSEGDLEYMHSDVEGENENTITQKKLSATKNGINIINGMKIRKNLIHVG